MDTAIVGFNFELELLFVSSKQYELKTGLLTVRFFISAQPGSLRQENISEPHRGFLNLFKFYFLPVKEI